MNARLQEIWAAICNEAQEASRDEALLASHYHAAILNHADFGAALGFLIASRLDSPAVPAMLIRQVCEQAYREQPVLVEAALDDLLAHYERDPACDRYCLPLLYFKGFHAIQSYRVAHWLWTHDRRSLALYFQNTIAAVFDVDIHPAASIGHGLMLDHATGLVIGETARLGDNVSLLHSVTLGGTGAQGGLRHPQVADGVMIAAGAKLIGPIRVGEGAKIGAGSVVLADVAAFTTVAGVPARPVGRDAARQQAALDMDQSLD